MALVIIVITNIMTKKLSSFVLICLIIGCFPMICWATDTIPVEGGCQQFNAVIDKAQHTSPADLSVQGGVIFLAYRAAINGQVSIYSLALQSSGYSLPLLPSTVAKPETFFLKQVMGNCAREAASSQYLVVVTETIISAIKDLYPSTRLKLDFKELLQQIPQPFPRGRIIGLGGESCMTVTDNIKNNPIKESLYSAWLSGYLMPYIMAQQLEPQQGLTLVGEVLQETTKSCMENPQVTFAEEALRVLKYISSPNRL